jgi:hypothetical protein
MPFSGCYYEVCGIAAGLIPIDKRRRYSGYLESLEVFGVWMPLEEAVFLMPFH